MGSVEELKPRILRLEEVDSTNEYARRMAPDVPEGTVVVARRQTSGRGREGRSWASPEGGLWMSMILKPKKVDPRLVFTGALAVGDVLDEFGIRSGIKWPNDVWVGGKKIAGVLTEGKAGRYVILGIGLNVNNSLPAELRETATSMIYLTGVEVPLDKVLERLVFHLNAWYRLYKARPDLLMVKVRERTFILGRTVEVSLDESSFIGRAVDVLDDGSLLLDVNGELRRVVYGDVSLRPL
ncbi:biotin--[acetyl-CoA-carboxylase] ligase [Thermococcus sp.]|uniref:biotin--[acetyl-CoA-carboxylase] ligase n=1 Tax=Thermococcus sp. TaxID=35749 RepID=UPI00345D61CC